MEIENINIILDPYQSGEAFALLSEFKVGIKKYLEELIKSPVRTLADIIAFNSDNPDLVSTCMTLLSLIHEVKKAVTATLFFFFAPIILTMKSGNDGEIWAR